MSVAEQAVQICTCVEAEMTLTLWAACPGVMSRGGLTACFRKSEVAYSIVKDMQPTATLLL